MSKSFLVGTLGLALVLAGVSGCSSKKAAIYEHENFADSGTFSRSFPVSEAGSCEAARRALLSQGYIITSSGAGQVNGNKSFQQSSESHLQISFNVTCAPDSGEKQGSIMFANALQDRYALKKSNTSASLGVGVLGSLSMPIGSSDDSMVKVASETVTSAQFYDRYFALVEGFLPKASKVASEPVAARPIADIGVPEPAAAPLAAIASKAPAAPAVESVAGGAKVVAPAATPIEALAAIASEADAMPAVASVEPVAAPLAAGASEAKVEASTPTPIESGTVIASEAKATPAVASVEPVAVSASEARAAPAAASIEPVPAPEAAAVAPASETPAAPVLDDSQGSQPIAPPAEAPPIQVQEDSQPTPL
ncbi:MAG TPA: DUF2242 domain-containing protein [Pseudomonas sp.]|nr:DUF2242 domain-containing protein [Pseudomonas sp.]HKS11453.1 DUF2242 domain-containing protein [Pseudomonas sp.]